MKNFTSILVIALASLLGSSVNGSLSGISLENKNCDFKGFVGLGGCFKKLGGKKSKWLNEMVYNGRDMIDWKNYKESLSKILCTCAGKAKKGGYKVIGLQYYGECWGAKQDIGIDYNPDLLKLRGGDCWTSDHTSSFKRCSYLPTCSGDGASTYVYSIPS